MQTLSPSERVKGASMPLHQPSDFVFDQGCSSAVRDAISSLVPRLRSVSRDVSSDVQARLRSLAGENAYVFPLRDRDGLISTATIEAVRRYAPHVTIFVVADSFSELHGRLTLLARAGADDAFSLDAEGDVSAIAHALRTRAQCPPPEAARRFLWGAWGSGPVRTEAMHCVRNAHRTVDINHCGRLFAVDVKTLRSRFHRAGLPTPWLLARLGRQLHAGELSVRHAKPCSVYARILGFATVRQFSADRRRVCASLNQWPSIAGLLV
jgi:hypothetical protein